MEYNKCTYALCWKHFLFCKNDLWFGNLHANRFYNDVSFVLAIFWMCGDLKVGQEMSEYIVNQFDLLSAPFFMIHIELFRRACVHVQMNVHAYTWEFCLMKIFDCLKVYKSTDFHRKCAPDWRATVEDGANVYVHAYCFIATCILAFCSHSHS